MEAEKKKVKTHKKVYTGPKIRFHSLTMPLIEELPSPSTDNVVYVDATGWVEECILVELTEIRLELEGQGPVS